MNHREYKDVFLLQDINIKIHKIMVLICSATLNRLEITTTNYKKKRFLVIKIHKTWNLHQHSKSLTRTIPVVLLHLFYKGTSSEEFDDALSAVWWRCTSNKAETCQNRRWKWKWLKYLRINLISTFYYYHWVDTFAGGLLIP